MERVYKQGEQKGIDSHCGTLYLPLALLSPSTLSESGMVEWAGFAEDGSDGIG